MLAHFVREERGVNAAEHDERATHAGASRHRVSTQGIGSMNADAHHVARIDLVRVERLQGLVDDNRCTEAGRRRCRQRGVMTAVPNERSLGLTR